MEDLVK